MTGTFPGRWPNASAISHCQIEQEDPLRFFVLGNSWHNFENRPAKLSSYFGWPRARIIINPVIIETGDSVIKSEEGCYSSPKQKTRKVNRYEVITCKYWTFFGKREKKFYLYRACLLQHEIDHADGIVIEDKYFKILRNYVGSYKPTFQKS